MKFIQKIKNLDDIARRVSAREAERLRDNNRKQARKVISRMRAVSLSVERS